MQAVSSVAATLALVSGALFLNAGAAQAAPTQTATISITPAAQSQPTGAAQTYSIALSCQGAGASECGPGSEITIPLDTTTTPSMTGGLWTYAATSGLAGFVTGAPTIEGNSLVIPINDSDFAGGFSGNVTLKMTPPNDVTPNDTTWQVDPTVTGGNIAPTTVPTPAQSTATATPVPTITKATADGGTVYEQNGQVTYNIQVGCNTAKTGSLYAIDGQLSDPIPAGMTFVSASAGATDVGGAVIWPAFNDPTTIPAGCAAGATGPTAYTVTLQAPPAVPAPPTITNTASVSITGADATNPSGISASTNASVPITIVNAPPTGGGPGYASINKTSLAPLIQPGVTSGNQYIATYPGDWTNPAARPSYSVGSAAAAFQTTVSYGLVGTYQTQIVDPLPCLSNPNGIQFPSASPAGAPCASPAFHPQVFEVTSAASGSNPGLGTAISSGGFQPTVTLSDGTVDALTASSTSANSAYYTLTGSEVTEGATITLPPNSDLVNQSLQLTVWGYADQQLANLNQSINELVNTATATPYIGPDPQTPINHSADIFTVPQNVQLGVSKSFGTTGAGPNGSTAVNFTGAVAFPTPTLAHDVVFTDLLPLGLTWTNPPTGTPPSITLTQGGNTTLHVTPTVADLQNYEGSGRELIRVTIPAADFTSAGSWRITPPANFIDVTTPTALGIYNNTDQLFLYGIAPQQIDPTCITPTQTNGGTSSSTFESANPMDLAGDGNLSEDYCQSAASLNILGSGPAFSLTKTVQGNLDTVPRGALGIGTASEGGSATYGLDWTNVGSDSLNDAVVYDILPHVGDTGVSGNQSSVQRGSQFATIFTGVTEPLPAGVSVEYSASTNPCRPEVFSTTEPACDNDWSANLPNNDPADVTALRFFSTTTYTTGQGFQVGVNVALPVGAVNQVAWNSAATNAKDVSSPSTPTTEAEPPKVGIEAPSAPTLTSSTSNAVVTPRTPITDTVDVTGTGGVAGTLTWTLVGPAQPVQGSCTQADWGGAPASAPATVATTGDGSYQTGPVTVTAAGCYSWTDALASSPVGGFPTPASLAAGSANEVTQVKLYQPALSTFATLAGTGSNRTIDDTIDVTGSGLSVTADSPTDASLDWTLFGPVAPVAGDCSAVDWTGAPTVATGVIDVHQDGQFVTPDTTITQPGCYTFDEQLAGTTDSDPASTLPGDTLETAQIPSPAVPLPALIGPTIGLLAHTGQYFPWQSMTAAGAILLLAGAVIVILDRRRRRGTS